MALCKEKIEKGAIRNMFAKPKGGFYKWKKRQINKHMRKKPIAEDDAGYKTARKPYRGWAF